MTAMKCPDCGAKKFYVKDPDDQFEISEFSLADGIVSYLDDEPGDQHIPVYDASEIFCQHCAWHDRFATLKPNG